MHRVVITGLGMVSPLGEGRFRLELTTLAWMHTETLREAKRLHD